MPPVCSQVTVELKNDLAITGTLHSVDQFLNIKLTNTRVVNEAKFPHMVSNQKMAVNSHPVATEHAMTQDKIQLNSFSCHFSSAVVCQELLREGICGTLCTGERVAFGV